jgi:CheY-like chemotaxis protein
MIATLRKILLAEDSENDIELTLAALASHHVVNEIVVVRDGVEALDYLHRRGSFASRPDENPALVLLDLKMPRVDGMKMPRVDGIEVLRDVKSTPALRTIPVVVLTSSREEQDLVRTYDLGVNAYVVKPVAFRDFMDAVKALGQFWAVINEAPPTRPETA